jgi:hypothetical protein
MSKSGIIAIPPKMVHLIYLSLEFVLVANFGKECADLESVPSVIPAATHGSIGYSVITAHVPSSLFFITFEV